MIIVMRDCRAAKMCSGGVRKWFDRHQLDWKDFLDNGLDEEAFLATKCPQAKRLVEVARGRQR